MLLQKPEAIEERWKKSKYSIHTSLATQALCLDTKEEFDEMILRPWKQPIKIEVDFEQRCKLRGTGVKMVDGKKRVHGKTPV